MPRYPDVNGARTSYCSIELGMAGFFFKGAKSINYKDKGELPKIYGTSAVPIGRPRGQNDSEGDIELYQQEWDELLPVITQQGRVGYMELAWPITCAYAEPSQPLLTKTDVLVGVRFMSADRGNSEGNEPLTVKLELSIMSIKWHGRYVALRGPGR
jgi:hypothetical protein